MRPLESFLKFLITAAILISVSLLPRGMCAQTRGIESGGSLLDHKLWKAMLNEYSGERAARHILELSKFHRISGGSPGYHDAVLYVTQVMKSLGPFEVEVEKHLSDGEKTYLQWRSMCGWDIKEAELWLENSGELLARYSDIPVSVFVYSNAADVSAEAVYAGRGVSDEDYTGPDVRGKIVLATGDGNSVHREAVIKRGAAGVVVGPDGSDPNRSKYPNLIPLHRLRSNKSLRENTRFGFSLSHAKFQKLLQLIKKGERVVLKAFVDAQLFDGTMETVSAVIKGSLFPQEEIIFVAHLDHYSPGANDNASGSASLIEIARVISSLIERGIIERPKRSIRFLWVGEMHGFAGYLSKNTSIGERGIAGINLDMVGEDLYKTHSVMSLVRTPFSNPSFVSDLAEHMIKFVDGIRVFAPTGSDQQFNYRVFSFRGGSDHIMLSDPTVNVPCVSLGHYNDIFHHTNMDDLDKVDPTELKRIGLISLGSALFLANAEETEAIRLATKVASQGLKRLSERTKRNMDDLYKISSDRKNMSDIPRYFRESNIFSDIQVQVETDSLRAVEALSPTPRVKGFIQKLNEALKSSAASEKKKIKHYYDLLCDMRNIKPVPFLLSADEQELSAIVPKRLFRGPISQFFFEDLMGEEGMKWYKEYSRKDRKWINRRTEILNFMDGKRSLLDIYYAVSAEFGRSDMFFYKKFTQDLRKHGLID